MRVHTLSYRGVKLYDRSPIAEGNRSHYIYLYIDLEPCWIAEA
jgi:hypothetical protein